MLTKGNHFLQKMMMARDKISKLGASNIPDGAVSTSTFFLVDGFV